ANVSKPTLRPVLTPRPEQALVQASPANKVDGNRTLLMLLVAGAAGLFALILVLFFIGFLAVQNRGKQTTGGDIAGANKSNIQRTANGGPDAAGLDKKPNQQDLIPFPPPPTTPTTPVLGGKPPEETPARDRLKELSDPDPKVRIRAIQEWGQLGAQGQAAVAHLLKALGDPDAAVSEEAAAALAKIAPPRGDD